MVTYKDLAGSEVKFDDSGDGLGRYNIYNFRQVRESISETEGDLSAAEEIEPGADNEPANNPSERNQESDSSQAQPEIETRVADFSRQNIGQSKFEYTTVGRWAEDDFDLNFKDMQFIQGQPNLPESYCSKPCEHGQAKLSRAGDQCCWICKTCAPYEYLPTEFECQDCGIGRWPNPDKKSCKDLQKKHLRWDSVYSIISLSVASLGLAITLFVTIIFVKYIDTPVVKASGRELSFILLAGIACCHLSTPVLLAKPTAFVCGSQRFLVSLLELLI